MKRRQFGLLGASSAIALGAGVGLPKSAWAAVAQAQANLLKTTLTPFGAERAGNADNSIPAWTGGETTIPAGWASPALMPDMFASDPPVVTINAANMAQYADRLPDSVQQMMKRVGFSIVVYPTRRSSSAPQYVYDYMYQNALNAQPSPGGARLGLSNAYGGAPFPIPSSDPMEAGAEIIQNHLLRWSGVYRAFNFDTYAVANGQLTMVTEDQTHGFFPYFVAGGNASNLPDNAYTVSRFNAIAPASQEGADTIIRQTIDSTDHPNSGWALLNGQGRVRRIPEVQYDVPDSQIDGITNYDESYGFLGALDEFDWKLIGKKEMYIPYNNNGTQFMSLSDFKPGYINPAVVRWELHRVWVVDATLHPGKRNVIPHRRFYLDEDTWAIGVVDEYDAQGNFWKMTNALNLVRPDIPGTIMGIYVTYNYQAGNYAASYVPPLDLPPSQRVMDFATPPQMSLFNPQDMAARASF